MSSSTYGHHSIEARGTGRESSPRHVGKSQVAIVQSERPAQRIAQVVDGRYIRTAL